MSITHTYKCDLCGTTEFPIDSNGQPTQFWRVGIGIAHYPKIPTTYDYGRGMAKDVCRKCAKEKLGLLLGQPKADEPAPPAPTFEDAIRELIREVVIEECDS